MKKISDLFDLFYGTNLELNRLIQHKKRQTNSVNFVSRTSKNNGVSALVELVDNITALPAGLITVAVGGSVMESFVQTEPFYTGRDVYCLNPKQILSFNEKIFYCICIRKNKYRYSYGRQANRTIKDILIPDTPPEWIKNITTISLEFQSETGDLLIK